MTSRNWRLIIFEEARSESRIANHEKTSHKGWIFRGAAEQNILKLFMWMIENAENTVNMSLPEPKEPEVVIIY